MWPSQVNHKKNTYKLTNYKFICLQKHYMFKDFKKKKYFFSLTNSKTFKNNFVVLLIYNNFLAGTEVGHNKSFKPHTDGYRLDIKVEMCNFLYITKNFVRIASERNGAPQYADNWGNLFALEGSNWNILIVSCPQNL